MQYVSLLPHLAYPSSAGVFGNLASLASREADKVLALLEKEKLIRKLPGGNPARYQVTDAARAKYLLSAKEVEQQTADRKFKEHIADREQARACAEQVNKQYRAMICDYLINVPDQYAHANDIATDLGFEDVRVVKAILYKLKEENVVDSVLATDNSGLYWCALPSGLPEPHRAVTAPKTKPVVVAAVVSPAPVAAKAVASETPTQAPTSSPPQRVVTFDMIVDDCAVFFQQLKAQSTASGRVAYFYGAEDVQDMPGMFYRKKVLRTVIQKLLARGVLKTSANGYMEVC